MPIVRRARGIGATCATRAGTVTTTLASVGLFPRAPSSRRVGVGMIWPAASTSNMAPPVPRRARGPAGSRIDAARMEEHTA